MARVGTVGHANASLIQFDVTASRSFVRTRYAPSARNESFAGEHTGQGGGLVKCSSVLVNEVRSSRLPAFSPDAPGPPPDGPQRKACRRSVRLWPPAVAVLRATCWTSSGPPARSTPTSSAASCAPTSSAGTRTAAGGYAGARDRGTLRLEGSDYAMRDGDVLTAKFTP